MVSGNRIFLLIVALGTLTVPRPTSAALIAILPSTQTAELGDQISVDLGIAGLLDGIAPSLGVYDIDFTFDPAFLSFSGVTWGNQLDIFGLGDVRSATLGFGFVNLFELSLESAADLNALQAGDFTLATLQFKTLAPGSSSLSLILNALGDAEGNSLPAEAVGGQVGITPIAPIPEPATISLVALGIGLSTIRRRRRSASRT